MNARSALLVAVVAVLAGGAMWLVRDLAGRSEEASNPAERTEPEKGAAARSAGEPALAVAATSGTTARVTIGENEPVNSAENARATALRLQVRVLRERTSAADVAVPNARVEIVDTGPEDGRPRWDIAAKGETDANGLFTFDAPRAFHATVRAEATIDGRKLFGVAWAPMPQVGERPYEVRLSEEPRRAVRVTVLDRDTLLPIVGADVRPSGGAEPTTTNALGECTAWIASQDSTDVGAWIGATGYFPVYWRSSRPSGLSVSNRRGRSGGALSAHFASPSLEAHAVAYLHRTAILTGTVLDAVGARVEGAELLTRVQFGNSSSTTGRDVLAVTDANGRFVFGMLPAGLALLCEVRLRGERLQCDDTTFQLEPGESRDVTLRVHGHVELTGRVLDVNDALVKGGRIKVEIDGRSDTGSIRSDGTYYLPFAVAGTGWISVSPEGAEEQRGGPHRVPIVIPSRVREWSIDVRIAPTVSVAGEFQDGDGRPVFQAQVLLHSETTPAFEATLDDGRGHFHFDAVPPGEYTLTGHETSGARRTARMGVRAGDRSVVLRLPVDGALHGRVVNAEGGALTYALVHVEPDCATHFTIPCAKDGTFRTALSPGSIWIWGDGGNSQSRRERVSVEPGRDTDVRDLVAAPTAELRFVTGRSGPRTHVAIACAEVAYLAFDIEPLSERTVRVPVGGVGFVATCAGHTTTRALLVQRGELVNLPLSCGP